MKEEANHSLADQKPKDKHLENDKRYLYLKQFVTNISVVVKMEF